jgi:chromosome segregation ATPase
VPSRTFRRATESSFKRTRVKKLNDELTGAYRSRDFKTNDLDNTCTRLEHARNELTAAQSYVLHLETELHERDVQLEVSQTQTANLQHEVEHLQELIPQESEEPEEPEGDHEEIEGMSGVEDS